jgi:divalent metal cation (Fe/Co/Zn/Cd) transporter
VYLSYRLRKPWIDGAGSIGVGLVLSCVAVIMIIETEGLLIGERASKEVMSAIEKAVRREPNILRIQRPLTMHLGPRDVLLAFGVEFQPRLSAADVSRSIERMERHIREERPEFTRIYVEAACVGGPGVERAAEVSL